jgi:hypothetical protein
MRLDALLLVIVLATTAALAADAPNEANDELKKDATVVDREAADELAKVQGKWSRTVKSDDGIYTMVKEHRGNATTVTVFDAQGNVVAGKKSEFRLEQAGKVRIFTFFDNVITIGPQQGQIDKGPHSYVYKIAGDSFYEVHGVLVGDDSEPLAFSWTRVKE